MNCSLPGSSVHGDSPGKNTRMGCHSLLQGIVPTQGSNPCLLCLLHWQLDSLPLCHLGSLLPQAKKKKLKNRAAICKSLAFITLLYCSWSLDHSNSTLIINLLISRYRHQEARYFVCFTIPALPRRVPGIFRSSFIEWVLLLCPFKIPWWLMTFEKEDEEVVIMVKGDKLQRWWFSISWDEEVSSAWHNLATS